MLTTVELASGKTAILCGSHALLYRRAGSMARSVGDLRASLEDRRETSRRREGGGDELGDRLVAAFTRDRRSAERRA